MIVLKSQYNDMNLNLKSYQKLLNNSKYCSLMNTAKKNNSNEKVNALEEVIGSLTQVLYLEDILTNQEFVKELEIYLKEG